jgi:hypothetical protein
VVVDAIRERRPPFSPEDVVSEFSELLKSYRISATSGDRYGGEWPRKRFKVHGINYEPAPNAKSDLYRDVLALLNSRKLDLLDNAKLINQFCLLERRVARGGRDSIDHAPGQHDDIANSVAGLAAAAAQATYSLPPFLGITANGSVITGGFYRADTDAAAADAASRSATESFQLARWQRHLYAGSRRFWR